ncbi:MAG TPA: hypothetical protein VF572_03265 [Candidatus Saccharimonadales bacterium]|jgi:hypothetical protein
MAGRTDEYGERRSGGGFKKFLTGLILGLLLGGAGAYAWLNSQDSKESTNAAVTTQAATDGNKDSARSSEQMKLTAAQQTQVDRYAQLLVEASREGVDVPSEEADAAKAALNDTTTKFLASMRDAKLLKDSANTEDLNATVGGVNNSFLQYAATARTGDNHQQVDEAVKRLSDYLKQNATFSNQAQFDATLVSFKNSVLESVRNFVKDDYAGSYVKEAEAQSELRKLVENLQKQ